jgi:hypothetical protein
MLGAALQLGCAELPTDTDVSFPEGEVSTAPQGLINGDPASPSVSNGIVFISTAKAPTCMGTLLNERWVLTSRGCAVQPNDVVSIGGWTARAGVPVNHAGSTATLVPLQGSLPATGARPISERLVAANEILTCYGSGPLSLSGTGSAGLRSGSFRVSTATAGEITVVPNDRGQIFHPKDLGGVCVGADRKVLGLLKYTSMAMDTNTGNLYVYAAQLIPGPAIASWAATTMARTSKVGFFSLDGHDVVTLDTENTNNLDHVDVYGRMAPYGNPFILRDSSVTFRTREQSLKELTMAAYDYAVFQRSEVCPHNSYPFRVFFDTENTNNADSVVGSIAPSSLTTPGGGLMLNLCFVPRTAYTGTNMDTVGLQNGVIADQTVAATAYTRSTLGVTLTLDQEDTDPQGRIEWGTFPEAYKDRAKALINFSVNGDALILKAFYWDIAVGM